MQKRGVNGTYFLIIAALIVIISFLLIFFVINHATDNRKSKGNLTNDTNTSVLNETKPPALNATQPPALNKTPNVSKPIVIPDPAPEEPEEKTCREGGGEICGENEECDEALFSASDTNQCCLGNCITIDVQKDYPAPSEVELAVHSKVNENRASAGVGSLEFHAGLANVARKHSQDMIDRNFFDHTNPDGLDPFDRIAAAGISCTWQGENIAVRNVNYGCGDGGSQGVADCIVNGWMNSSGHRTNILTEAYKKEGIGVAITSDGEVYATQVFCD